MPKQLTERQKDAAKRVYDTLIAFLEEFKNTDAWRTELLAQGEDAVFAKLTERTEHIQLVLNQEYFDLHDHEIYDALCEFAGEDLPAVYSGKLGGDPEDCALWQDYERAMQRLNEIVERYL